MDAFCIGCRVALIVIAFALELRKASTVFEKAFVCSHPPPPFLGHLHDLSNTQNLLTIIVYHKKTYLSRGLSKLLFSFGVFISESLDNHSISQNTLFVKRFWKNYISFSASFTRPALTHSILPCVSISVISLPTLASLLCLK